MKGTAAMQTSFSPLLGRRRPAIWSHVRLHFLCFYIIVSFLGQCSRAHICPINSPVGGIDLSEPINPSVFYDLTRREIEGLQYYLYMQPDLNLVLPDRIAVDSSYVFTMDLYPPNKLDVLQYFSNQARKPQRAAIVTIFRGDLREPIVEEYIVFPLPRPTSHHLLRTVPFEFRPPNSPELGGITEMLTMQTHNIVRQVLEESFGGTTLNCGDRCLVFRFITPIGPAVSKIPGSRKIWFWTHQNVEYFASHFVDFGILVNIDRSNYNIEKVWYNNLLFDSLQELAMQYNAPGFPKLVVPFPQDSRFLFSKAERRGVLFPKIPVTPPRQVEPDGKRYSIFKNEVRYMNWRFNFRLSTVHGPQLFDIRYLNERIVYELGLQEMFAWYSGVEPAHQYANFFDSYVLIGLFQVGLVPGVDCPTHATFIDRHIVTESSLDPVLLKNTFCVFELNTGEPLRRHFSKQQAFGQFFEGAPGNALVFRTNAAVVNYDYQVDFIFHQNGVLQVKVVPTGYILPSQFTINNNDEVGFRINNKLVGNLHQHSFNFKVDIDVHGLSNRYGTLDVVPSVVSHPLSSIPNDVWFQTKLQKSRKETEQDALFKFNFDTPKLHLFFNEEVKSPEGNVRAYRLINKGMSKSLLPEGFGNEPSQAWNRHQLVVTKRKESERFSSSMFAILDSARPTADIRTYYGDNENIVDEDIVAWVTMGTHHVPISEDLPVTHTPGNDLSFFLSPFNNYPEDPGMGSRDSTRIELRDKSDPRRGLRIDKQTFPEKLSCVPPMGNYFEFIQRRPEKIFPPA